MSVFSLPDLTAVRRVLIIRMSAIGDVVHALPLSAALKEAYPHLEITWLVEEIAADMVTGNPCLHEVLVIPRARWNQGRLYSVKIWREILAFWSDLRRRRFDVTIDLQGYGKSALMALATGARYRLGWWRLRDGANLVSRALPRRVESVHRVDWFLDVARALGIMHPSVRFPLHVPEEARAGMAERLQAHGIAPGQPYVVINQAAGNVPRCWVRERYGDLALALLEKRKLPTVLIGTKAEAPDCEAIVAQVRAGMSGKGLRDTLEPLNLAGQTTLKELAALLEGCILHICGDTGSTHIAAGLGTPVVAFYGSSDPAHAGPWGQSENVVSRRDLCHADCTVRQCAYAPGGSQAAIRQNSGFSPPVAAALCMEAITVEEAMTKVEQVLQQGRSS